MIKRKTYSALTVSLQNKGHGTFPRHEKMAIALKNKGYDVIWISPPGYKNKDFKNISLVGNFIPDFFFIGIYLKVFLTCIYNIKLIRDIDIVFAIREYDAMSIFFNPFFKKAKKIFFSRGDVVSILKINLPDKNFIQKIKDRFIILVYPTLQKIIYKKTDLTLLQTKFLKSIFERRLKCSSKNIKVLPNNCINKPQKKSKYLKLDNKKIIIGFAAPMYWSCKGLETILEIYKELVDKKIFFKLEIAGKGPQEFKLKSALHSVSDQHYKWNGWVNNIDNFFNKIDILVVSSLYDSSPNLLLEALQKKKIIFASNISAHKEILKYNELLFSKKKIKNLITRIEKINKSEIYKKNIEKKILNRKKNSTFDWELKFYELIKKC